tara:strand:+ start:649 stop:1248 length:600 start_codon:yes stop_codon:yes gene_type:complete
MPVKKKVKKPRVKKPKGLRQKQKQKQQQKVSVNVSAGGSGGGGYIPIPQAPAFDYNLLSQLIRPANTVDVPLIAQANPEPIMARAPVEEAIRPAFQVPVGAPSMKKKAPIRFAEGDAPAIESERFETERAPRSDKNKPRGSYKEKAILEGRDIQNQFALRASSPSASESEDIRIRSGGNIRAISEYMQPMQGGGGAKFV